jgi:hypothetical protein
MKFLELKNFINALLQKLKQNEYSEINENNYL